MQREKLRVQSTSSEAVCARISRPELGIANGIGSVRITKRVITVRADGRVRIDQESR